MLASAEIYDPTSNVWAFGPSMASARFSHTATLLNDGRVLVAGGGDDSGCNLRSLASAESYDPVSNTWTAAASLSTARLSHSATLVSSGRVLVAGGRFVDTSAPAGSWPPIASAEVFDLTANAWRSAASMMNARESHAATLLIGGAVFVTGGENFTAGVLSSSELYW